jgi:hypothetical protein
VNAPILFLAAVLASPSAGPADSFCDDARTLAAGAEEAQPFASLVARHFSPRLLGDFCFHSDANGYTCGQSFAPADLTRDSVARRLLSCLPGASLTADDSGYAKATIVRRGRFEARVTEHGTERSHVGRQIEIIISAR